MLVIYFYTQEDVDYEAGPYYVNFTEGDMSAEFCINITDNNDLENDKYFTLRMNRATLHPENYPMIN